jgi:hypothetical protein
VVWGALAIAASEAGAAHAFGFGSISAQLALFSLSLPLVLAGSTLTARCFPEAMAGDAAIRTAVAAFGIVVFVGLSLGAARLIGLAPYAIAEGAVLIVVLVALRRPAGTRDALSATAIPVLLLGLWVAVVAFVVGMGISHSPYTAYDGLSYHLFFPARWLQAHRLSIIPTPFSDEAQAYQPGNGELWFLWLMLPFHGDFLSRIGQVPFYVLGATTAYLLALRCGAERRHAVYAPTFFLVTPAIVEQAVGADVDLIAAVMFVAAVYFGIVAAESNRRRDWAMWGAAVGLFLGTKYLALVYLPVLLVLAVLRGVRLRALWGLPGIAALGAPWYLRNWLVAGSPIYPATLTVGDVTLGQGAYSHRAMLQSFMHTSDPRLLAVSFVHAFGTAFLVASAPLAVLAIAMVVKRRAWWPAGAMIVAVAAVAGLCWASVGDNTDARFLLPAVALFPALVPLAFGAHDRVNRALQVYVALAVAWVIIGLDRQLHVDVPWFMADWLPWYGIVDHRFVVLFGATVLLGTFVCLLASRRRVVGAAAAGLAAAAGVTLAMGAETWCLPGRCDYLQIASPHLRLTFLYGGRWLNDHVHGANIAYSGINLPYPLAGSHLSNVVSYVNIDNHVSWRFDQYAAAWGRARGPQAGGGPLARPSGALVPAPQADDAERPRFERRFGDRDAWRMNLKREQITYVFLSTLDSYEIDYVWHNAQGFPIEDEWAKADPSAFRLVYENAEVRIYEVTL